MKLVYQIFHLIVLIHFLLASTELFLGPPIHVLSQGVSEEKAVYCPLLDQSTALLEDTAAAARAINKKLSWHR